MNLSLENLKKYILSCFFLCFFSISTHSADGVILYAVTEEIRQTIGMEVGDLVDSVQYYIYLRRTYLNDSTEEISAKYIFLKNIQQTSKIWMPDSFKLIYNFNSGSIYLQDSDSLYDYSHKKCLEYVKPNDNVLKKIVRDIELRKIRMWYYEELIGDVGEILSINGKVGFHCSGSKYSQFFINNCSYVYCLANSNFVEVRHIGRFNSFSDPKVYPSFFDSVFYPYCLISDNDVLVKLYKSSNISPWGGLPIFYRDYCIQIIAEYDAENICTKIEYITNFSLKKIIKVDSSLLNLLGD